MNKFRLSAEKMLFASLCLAHGASAFAHSAPSAAPQGTGEAPAGMPSVTASMPVATTTVGQFRALSRADAAFLQRAAQNGQTELASSKMALERGLDTQVKGFAQQMLDDHGKAASALQALAGAKGVSLPTQPSLRQKARLKLLGGATGARFDQRFADVMAVAAHRDTVQRFEKAASTATDGEVRAFAQATLPTLRNHLKMATELKQSMDKTKRKNTGTS
jgi:putative membrane protein